MIKNKKMTEEQIIKALDFCRKGSCSTCPRIANDKCFVQLSEEAVDIINRQKAEIKRLEHIKDTIAILAIKKFAERVKAIKLTPGLNVGESIDNLVKEMEANS